VLLELDSPPPFNSFSSPSLPLRFSRSVRSLQAQMAQLCFNCFLFSYASLSAEFISVSGLSNPAIPRLLATSNADLLNSRLKLACSLSAVLSVLQLVFQAKSFVPLALLRVLQSYDQPFRHQLIPYEPFAGRLCHTA
jgi:hypothetical protein